MLDLELLNTLVCVVDERSFTRAADRVHRTQSTVSQQIRKLEESVGRALLLRDRTGNQVTPTEHGELLAHYARRPAGALPRSPGPALERGQARAGANRHPEDFDARRMSAMLSGFVRRQPGARLETVSGMSTDLRRKLAEGELELALLKREPGSGECLASWPESLVWVCGPQMEWQALGDEPCRSRCSHTAASTGIARFAGSTGRSAAGASRSAARASTGIQAAVSSGLGVSVLPTTAVLARAPDLRRHARPAALGTRARHGGRRAQRDAARTGRASFARRSGEPAARFRGQLDRVARDCLGTCGTMKSAAAARTPLSPPPRRAGRYRRNRSGRRHRRFACGSSSPFTAFCPTEPIA
ncbi:MAG: LysR family transcriptional regulator [Pararobbsia sp.]